MNRAIYSAVLTITISLAACGTPAYVAQTDQYVRQGNCDAALQTVENSGETPGRKSYMIAGVYANCQRNQAKAIEWATLSARYDIQAARDYLARVGAPIPSPDLAPNNDNSAASDALFYNLGYALGTAMGKH